MAQRDSFDIAVIGGGLVGAALAFGMREAGRSLVVLDEGDVALRPSRGNFGLIWVQGKGVGSTAYGSWTQRSAREWPALADELRGETGVDVALAQPGGLVACLDRHELDAREAMFARLFAQPGFERYDVEFLDRRALQRRLPGVGPGVVGGTWCAKDGHCNPLHLLRALHVALRARGADVRPSLPVSRIEPREGRFVLSTVRGPIEAQRVVVAAGLASVRLAPMVGLAAPVAPNKGHVVALERVAPFLPFPIENIRQTDEGTVLLGDSRQDRGFDDALEMDVAGAVARRALAILPALADVRVVRAWAALRVMTPDGLPVYAESETCPGAFVAACHSGVTLAAAHARVLGPAILAGRLPAELRTFHASRFGDVRAAA